MPLPSDRNLLFAVLAVQLDFVSPGDVKRGIQAWLAEKHRSLSTLLVECDAMQAEEVSLLEPLVDAHIEQHGGDAGQSLAALSSDGGLLDCLKQIADEDLQASLSLLPQSESEPLPDAGAQSTALPPEGDASHQATIDESEQGESAASSGNRGKGTRPSQRFRIVRPHAEGGLGRVFVAVDQELNREVAFKDIKPQHARRQDAQSRFMVEAEVTGGLEHPGIVPVYGLGHFPDGRPFYAMRFVRGQSLHDAIREFHRPSRDPESSLPEEPASSTDGGESVDFSSRAFRDLINRLIDVCNAMQYAHDRKVLHRDLKPGNIMLGKYGETLVVDWGLAKATGVDVPKQHSSETEQPIIPASGSQSAPTMAGSTIGTPAYMPPEQADGRIEELGPASDVYSLGATLYEILAGERPLKSVRLPDLLERVREGDIPPPRSLSHEIPAALNAVCVKAMAARAEDRYGSAKALADDLEAWLADEPVAAYPEPFVIRARRWVRRHPALVSATVAGVLMAVVGLSALSTVVTSKNKALTASNARATAGEALAQRNARAAELQRDAAKAAQSKAEASEARAIKGEQLAESRRLEAEAERKATKQELYFSQINRAVADIEAGQHDRALKVLESIPFSRREWEAGYLIRQAEGTPLTLRNESSVKHVSFNPDGTQIVAAVGAKLKIWDAFTGEKKQVIHYPEHWFNCVEFSPDGSHIVSSNDCRSIKGEIIVWDADTGEEKTRMDGHIIDVATAGFNPDGTQIIGARNVSVFLWDALTGKQLKSYHVRGDTAAFRKSTHFSPDGNRFVDSGADKLLQVWDVESERRLLKLRGQGDASFSPDGNFIAAGDEQAGVVALWDAETGEKLKTFQGHTGRISSVVFSPDGRRLASADSGTFSKPGGEIRVWDVAGGEQLLELRGHAKGISQIEFGPYGRRIVSGSYDGTVRIWDVGQHEPVLISNSNYPDDVQFVAETGHVVAGGQDDTVQIWDPLTRRVIQTLEQPDWDADRIAVSSDGKMLATGHRSKIEHARGERRGVKLWSLETGEELLPLSKTIDEVQDLEMSQDGQHVAACSPDALAVWDTVTGKLRFRIDDVSSASLAFSPDARRIACNDIKALRIWDTMTGEESSNFQGSSYVRNVSFSPDGSRVAFTDGAIRVLNLDDREELLTLRGHTRYKPIHRVLFSPNGRRLVSGSDDTNIKLWDSDSGRDILTLNMPVLRGSEPGVRELAFNRNGDMLASADFRPAIWLWDARVSSHKLRLRGHSNKVYCAGFSPGGRRLVSGSGSRHTDYENTAEAIVWDVTTGRELVRFERHEGTVESVKFSADGEWILSCSSRNDFDKPGEVRLWHSRSSEQRHALMIHEKAVWDASFRPDGQRIASASQDETVAISDSTTGEKLLVLNGHDAPVRTVEYSSNGDRLVSGGDDRVIRIWDAESGTEMSTLVGHESPIRHASFSQDGKQVVSASEMNSVRVWDVSTGTELVNWQVIADPLESVEFTPDGTHVVARDVSDDVFIWNVGSGEQVETGLPEGLRSGAFSPDGQLLFIRQDADVSIVRPDSDYAPWKEFVARWNAWTPDWFEENAIQSLKQKNLFAFRFHLSQLERLVELADDGNQRDHKGGLYYIAAQLYARSIDTEWHDEIEDQDQQQIDRESVTRSIENLKSAFTAGFDRFESIRDDSELSALLELPFDQLDSGILNGLSDSYLAQGKYRIDHTTVGEAENSRRTAMKYFKRAVEFQEELLSRDPENSEVKCRLTQALLDQWKLGQVIAKEDSDKPARQNSKHIRKILQFVEPLAEANPDDTETQITLSDIYFQIGSTKLKDGQKKEVRESFDYLLKAVEIRKRCFRNTPTNPELRQLLVEALVRLDSCNRKLDNAEPDSEDFRLAFDTSERYLGLVEELGNAKSAEPEALENLYYWYGERGWLFKNSGDLPQCAKFYEKAIAIAERRANADPSNDSLGWKVEERAKSLSDTYYAAGIEELEKGNTGEALAYFQKDMDLFDRLKSPSASRSPHSDLIRKYYGRGTENTDKGIVPAARFYCRELADLCVELEKEKPGDRAILGNLADMYFNLGRLHWMEQGYAEAARLHREAVDAIDRIRDFDDYESQYIQMRKHYQSNADTLALLVKGTGELKTVFKEPPDQLVDILNARCTEFANLGRFDDVELTAVDTRRYALEEATEHQSELLFVAATGFGMCANAVSSSGSGNLPEEQLARRNDLTERSYACLKESISRGNDKVETIAHTGKLSALLELPVERLIELDADNGRFLLYVSYSCLNYGDERRDDDQQEAAVSAYHKCRILCSRLVEENATNFDAERQLAISFERLGSVERSREQFALAREWFEQEIAIAEKRVERDPSVVEPRTLVAIAYRQMGSLCRSEKNAPEAVDWFQKVTDVRVALDEEDSNVTSRRNAVSALKDLADSLEMAGNRSKERGDQKNALGYFVRESEARNHLFERVPENKQYQLDLGPALTRAGDLATELRELEQAESIFRQKLKFTEFLIQRFPSDSSHPYTLSFTWNKLGLVSWHQGALQKAVEHYTRAVAIREKLTAENPGNAERRKGLVYSLGAVATCMAQLAEKQQKQNELKKSAELYEKAVEIRERIVNLNSADADAQRKLASLLVDTGDFHEAAGDDEQTLRCFLRSAEIAETVAEIYPDDLESQRALSIALSRLGQLYRRQGQLDEALRFVKRDLAIAETLAAAEPDNEQRQNDVSFSLEELGEICREQQKLQEALTWYARKREFEENYLKRRPDSRRFRGRLAYSLQEQGELNRELGKLTESVELFTREIELRTALADAFPTEAPMQRSLMFAHYQLGNVYSELFQYQEAGQNYRAGGVVLRRMIENGQSVEKSKRDRQVIERLAGEAELNDRAMVSWDKLLELPSGELTELLPVRCSAFVKQKKLDEAARSVNHLRELSADAEPDQKKTMLYEAARGYAQCITSLLQNADDIPARDVTKKREGFTRLAIACLKEAIEAGYKDFDQMKQDADLTALHDLPKFKALIPKPKLP